MYTIDDQDRYYSVTLAQNSTVIFAERRTISVHGLQDQLIIEQATSLTMLLMTSTKLL